jgi:hypothetical protein
LKHATLGFRPRENDQPGASIAIGLEREPQLLELVHPREPDLMPGGFLELEALRGGVACSNTPVSHVACELRVCEASRRGLHLVPVSIDPHELRTRGSTQTEVVLDTGRKRRIRLDRFGTAAEPVGLLGESPDSLRQVPPPEWAKIARAGTPCPAYDA